MKAYLGLAAAAALLLGSCYTPLFDPAISAGALFASKLGKPTLSIGPLSSPRSAELGWRFLPDRSPGARQGLLEVLSSQGSSLIWLLPDGGGGSYMSQEFMQVWLPAGSKVPFAAMSVPGTPPSMLYHDQSWLEQATAVPGSQPTIVNYLSPVTGWNLAGAGVAQLPGNPDLAIALLYKDSSSGWAYLFGDYSSLPNASPQTPLPCPSPGIPAGGAFFAASASGPFYYGEPGGPRTASWDGSAPSWTIMDLGAPLVGILSNGYLLAQDDYRLSLWSDQGTKVFSLPAGNIRFAEEISGPSGQLVVLTRCLEFAGKDSPTLRIDSWEVPLAEFLRL